MFPTRPDNGPLLHQDHCVRLLHKLQAMSAEDPGLALEELDHTLLHQVFGHVRVDRCQRVIQQVDVLVLKGSYDANPKMRSLLTAATDGQFHRFVNPRSTDHVDGPGKGQPGLLSSTQSHSVLPHLCLVPLRQHLFQTTHKPT